MSRIGRKPINIPAGVDVKIENGVVTVKGPKGELTRQFAIVSIPTLVLMQKGKLVRQMIGYHTLEEILAFLDQ